MARKKKVVPAKEADTNSTDEVVADERAAKVAALQSIPESERTDEDVENLTRLLAS